MVRVIWHGSGLGWPSGWFAHGRGSFVFVMPEVHFPERWRERSVVTGDGLGDIIHELIALHTTFVVGCTNS